MFLKILPEQGAGWDCLNGSYLKVHVLYLNMLMKKRGLSGILAVVIMILLAIVAVAIVWLFIRGAITRTGEQIYDDAAFTEVKFSIVPRSIFISADGNTSFVTRREAGGGNVSGVLIILEDRAKNRYSWFNLSKKGNVEIFESIPISISRDEHRLGDVKHISVHATSINKQGLLIISRHAVAEYNVPDDIAANQTVNGSQLYPDGGGGSGGSGEPAPIYYTLTLEILPPEGGSVSKNPDKAQYSPGEQVTLTATNNTDYDFAGWDDGFGIFDTSFSTVVTMNSDKHISAIFPGSGEPVHTLITWVSPPEAGNVIASPNRTSFLDGEQVNLTFTVSGGQYAFNHWEDNGVASGSSVPYQIVMDQNHNVAAIFDAAFSLTTNVLPGAGSGVVTRSPNKSFYSYQERVNLTAINNATSFFDHWEEEGKSPFYENPLAIAMDSDRTINAVFGNDVTECRLIDGYADCSDAQCQDHSCAVSDGTVGTCQGPACQPSVGGGGIEIGLWNCSVLQYDDTVYVLDRLISYSGSGICIDIKGNNTVLDGGGNLLVGEGQTGSIGVRVDRGAGASVVLLRNLNIVYFGTGILSYLPIYAEENLTVLDTTILSSGAHGIELMSDDVASKGYHFENVYIIDSGGHGISGVSISSNIFLNHVYSAGNDLDGIALFNSGGGGDTKIINSVFVSNGQNGLSLTLAMANLNLTNVTAESNAHDGIVMGNSGTYPIYLSGSHINHNGFYGIFINDANYYIRDNVICYNSQGHGSTYKDGYCNLVTAGETGTGNKYGTTAQNGCNPQIGTLLGTRMACPMIPHKDWMSDILPELMREEFDRLLSEFYFSGVVTSFPRFWLT